MKSKLRRWGQVEENPSPGYRDFFSLEESYLRRNINKNTLVLDIGCATGRITKILSNISKKVIGIDNSYSAVKECKQNTRGATNISCEFGDAEKMRFKSKSKSFDVVVCLSLFENLETHRHKILLEIGRVLKDEGIVIFSAYNENALNERLRSYRKIEQKPFKVSGGKVIFYDKLTSEQFSKKQLIEMLERAGFKIINLVKGKIFYLGKARKQK